MITLQFLITSLIVVLIPGPGVICTVSTALVHGRRASLFAAIGCTVGIVPHLLATIFGLAALLHASAMAFQVLKYAGVLYLLYMAVMTWRDTTALAIDENVKRSTDVKLMGKAMLLNTLNPKLTIFFLAFLPQFVDPADPGALPHLLLLSGVFMAMTFGVFVAYGLVAHALRSHVIDSPTAQRWMRNGFSAAFAGLGIKLALSER